MGLNIFVITADAVPGIVVSVYCSDGSDVHLLIIIAMGDDGLKQSAGRIYGDYRLIRAGCIWTAAACYEQRHR